MSTKAKEDDFILKFESIIPSFSPDRQRALRRSLNGKTSTWLNVLPLQNYHFDLSPLQFRDGLAIRYLRDPPCLPPKCDGCGTALTLQHALDCKKGGLVIQRHNEIRDCIGDIASQVEALFDVKVVDTDAPSHRTRSSEAILESGAKEKKRVYEQAVVERRGNFTPIVLSVDEGTTQGDPLAMPMHALGILPLIQRSSVDVNQVWYADDAAATGTVLNLKECHMQHIPHCYYPATCSISHIATTQPHAAFTHGLVHKWSYLARTVPDITRLFQPLEDVIRTKFIPCLTGRAPPNDLERNLLSLPPKLGGLGIPDPTITSDTEYTASRSVCKPLYNLILLHDSSYPTEAIEQQVEAKKEVHSLKLKHSQGSAFNLRPQLANSTQRSMDLAQEKGASNWLTILPIDENGFTLHKGAFRDAIALRHGWLPSNIPSTCTCGKSFTNLMTEVCHNVSIEPHLQPITAVKKLLEWRQDEEDAKWAEKAINLLIKKLSSKLEAIEELQRVLENPFYPSKCVTIPQTLHGRLQDYSAANVLLVSADHPVLHFEVPPPVSPHCSFLHWGNVPLLLLTH
eukprot:Em0005g102a